MKTLQALAQDHRVIRDMLDRLEDELEAAATFAVLDGEAVDQLLAFFEHEVDGHHQEKEERVFLPRLLQRVSPEEALLLQSLLQDHGRERRLLEGMRRGVEGAAYGDPFSVDAFVQLGREYISHQRRHSAWEQRVLFPLGQRLLTTRDDRVMIGRLQSLERARGATIEQIAARLACWLDRRRPQTAA